MLTLAFDTSGKTAAVAILRDDIIIYDVIINSGSNHSEVLLPAIHQACAQSGIKIDNMDLFACTIGPGYRKTCCGNLCSGGSCFKQR